MRVTWHEYAFYSRGVSNGVLYPQNSPGVAWNGLTSVTENGDDAVSSLYLDGQKFRDRIVPSAFAGTIEAFTYPDVFDEYNGLLSGISGQPRKPFGFTYRSSNEIHLVYNVLAGPSSEQYSSASDVMSPAAFSWDFTTLPVDIPGGRASAHLVILVDYANADAISDLEDMIYGNEESDAYLPDPATVIAVFESHTTLMIVDNGDGTWTATGPDNAITMLSDTEFQIDWPSAIFVDSTSYRIYSL